jgi:thiamine pyrophosphokinase
MSSHHIVRDNQEPALLVLNASQMAFDVIEELLEWSPSIIVHETQMDLFLSRGIKIDAVIFEEAHRSDIMERVYDQLPVHLLSYKTESPLERAVAFLQEKNHGYVNIITENRESLKMLQLLENPKNISAFQNNIRWSLVRSGHFEKWVDEKVHLYLLQFNEKMTLYPNSENMIKVDKIGSFWIGEPLREY